MELLKDGLPGALVTALILAVHEIAHFAVAKTKGIKLAVPYFVPSWQVCPLYVNKLPSYMKDLAKSNPKHLPLPICTFCL